MHFAVISAFLSASIRVPYPILFPVRFCGPYVDVYKRQVYNASKAKVENYKELGLNSETAVVFNITSREQVIINTWYGGEMKKGRCV